jgi:thiamine-phosphate pyrophosphorylase
MSGLRLRGFYAILDVTGASGPAPHDLVRRAEALLSGGACCLQLRAKQLGGAAFRDAARAVLPVCRAAGVPFCVNDRLDVALVVGADLVHVGQDDLDLGDVRRVLAALGRRVRVGVSTHNLAQARAAEEAGADYIGFGPIFGTTSKANPDPTVGLEGLSLVCAAASIPVVAIGGITRATAGAVAAAGAAAAAVIADVARAENPAVAARQIAAAFSPPLEVHP